MTWDSRWEEIFKTQPWGKYPGEELIRFVARNFFGDGTGESLGQRAWSVSEGPMLGKGLSRFTDEADFGELFPPQLTMRSCEMLTRTADERAHTVREWILELQKQN